MKAAPDLPEEEGRDHLRRALGELPDAQPDAATWSRIAGQLAARQAITAAIPHLPEHEPGARGWEAIAARLDAGAAAGRSLVPDAASGAATRAPVVRSLWPARLGWVAGLAATVLLLLGAWALWPPATPPAPLASVPHETVTYSEEVALVPTAPPVDALALEGEAFIDAHCTSLPTVCQSDEFQLLRTQLSEVAAQQQRLQQDAERFGSSPALLREQGQLTALHATLTRELVQLLIS